MTTKQKLLSYNNQKAKLAYRQAGVFFCQVCSSLYLRHFTAFGDLLSVKLNKKITKNCSDFCHLRIIWR